MTVNLADLRVQIDALDKQLLTLLNQRALVAEQVGEVKKREGTPFFRPDRVAQVIEKIQQANQGPLKNEHVAAVWREIMSACLALESPVRVAYLGPAGTFSEEAAVQFFGSSIEHVPCTSFDEVFRAATAGTAEFGVVPVENSTEGVVTHTLDMFVDSDLKVVAQIILPVQQCLLSNSPRKQIKRLYVHPQSLAQCRGWIQNNLPNVEIIETSSNARSAEFAAKEKNSAAIAGILAAEKYGLPVLEQDIQDNAANATRFLVLGRKCSPPTGNDRTSLMVSITDKVGALHHALAAFRRNRINLTKIESRPSKRRAWEYFFFIDCDGHQEDRKVAKAIEQLALECSFVKVLGSYPNSE